ncbi:MAG: hypothetical protein AAF597_13790 [Bacteroidota bacterium]
MQRFLPLLTLLLISVACTRGPAPEKTETATFFDLSGYMDGEIERLTTAKIRANKSITLNGATEEQEGVAINYANDLRLFRDADINRPAWIEKYQTEVEKLSGNHQITTYTTLDSALVVHRLLVEEDQGVPVKIEIDRKTGTVLSDGFHRLRYAAGEGYSVNTKQTNRFGDDIDALIVVEW